VSVTCTRGAKDKVSALGWGGGGGRGEEEEEEEEEGFFCSGAAVLSSEIRYPSFSIISFLNK
jgi:hypothetical protein